MLSLQPTMGVKPSPSYQVRLDARSGKLTTSTANLAPGHVQANLAILPKALAADFLLFCQRNPKPCPLLAMSDPGDPSLAELGRDIDIRSDLPRYVVWRDGVVVDKPTDASDLARRSSVFPDRLLVLVRRSDAGQ